MSQTCFDQPIITLYWEPWYIWEGAGHYAYILTYKFKTKGFCSLFNDIRNIYLKYPRIFSIFLLARIGWRQIWEWNFARLLSTIKPELEEKGVPMPLCPPHRILYTDLTGIQLRLLRVRPATNNLSHYKALTTHYGSTVHNALMIERPLLILNVPRLLPLVSLIRTE
jgi:hypothetical protein